MLVKEERLKTKGEGGSKRVSSIEHRDMRYEQRDTRMATEEIVLRISLDNKFKEW